MGAAGAFAVLILWLITSNNLTISNNLVIPRPDRGIDRILSAPYLAALFGGFLTHAALTALFMFLPQWIEQQDFSANQTWQFYAPVFIVSFGGAMQFIRWTEKNHTAMLPTMLIYAALFLSLMIFVLMTGHQQFFALFAAATGFFTAFAFLEAGLPAYVSTIVNPGLKGTAMGIYATCQFFGIFCGGLLGGYLL